MFSRAGDLRPVHPSSRLRSNLAGGWPQAADQLWRKAASEIGKQALDSLVLSLRPVDDLRAKMVQVSGW